MQDRFGIGLEPAQMLGLAEREGGLADRLAGWLRRACPAPAPGFVYEARSESDFLPARSAA